MKRWLYGVLAMAGLCGLGGCALSPGYQKPTVDLVKIQPLSASGLEQRFLIGLRIVNPNDAVLSISGLSYSLRLQGHKVLSGVSSNITIIPAYREARMELEAATSLVGGLKALIELLNQPQQPVAYQLETRLSINHWPWPVTVVEQGTIPLGSPGAPNPLGQATGLYSVQPAL